VRYYNDDPEMERFVRAVAGYTLPPALRSERSASTLSGPSWPDRQPTGVDQGAAIRHASAQVATVDGKRPEPACYAVDRFPPEAQS